MKKLCANCKWRTGTKCRKNNESITIEWDAEMGHSSKNAIEILNQHGYRAKAGDHSLRDAVLEALPIARPMNCNGRTYLDSKDTYKKITELFG